MAAMIAAAGIAAGGSLLGGLFGASGAEKAAKIQADAARQAAQLQYTMYNQTVGRLQPWVDTGTAAAGQLGGLMGLPGYSASGAGGLGTGALVQPFNPTMEQLAQTPGYQFTLNQGLAATRNAASAMGLGGGIAPGGKATDSGPEMGGEIKYAENLAENTFQQQFNNYWSQLGNIYNMLSGQSASGANAAALTGQSGSNAAIGIGNTLQAGAASSAAGVVGAANALGGGVAGAGNAALQYAMLNSLPNQSGNPVAQGAPIIQGTGGTMSLGGSPITFNVTGTPAGGGFMLAPQGPGY